MNWRNIWAIARKDLKEVRQNRAAWLPAIILPLIFAVVMPLVFILLPQFASLSAGDMEEVDDLLSNLPLVMQVLFEGRSPEQTFVIYMTGFMLAPMLLILPLMFSTVIGSEAFVGERERKTLEALLYAPASDLDLFLGKVLAAVLPAVIITWLTSLVYAIVVNVASYPLFGAVWFPLAPWWPMIFWLAPALAVLGISVTVLISSRVRTFMEAYQMSAALVIFVLALILGQVSGVLVLGVGTVFVIGTLVWLVDAVLIYVSVSRFKRSSLVAKL
jgi:ABC-2 type transport system permease protein